MLFRIIVSIGRAPNIQDTYGSVTHAAMARYSSAQIMGGKYGEGIKGVESDLSLWRQRHHLGYRGDSLESSRAQEDELCCLSYLRGRGLDDS